MRSHTKILSLLLLAAPATAQNTIVHHAGFNGPVHQRHFENTSIGSGFLVAESGSGQNDGRVTFLEDVTLSRQEVVVGLTSVISPEQFPSGPHEAIITSDNNLYVVIGKTGGDLSSVVVGFDLDATPWTVGSDPLTVDDIDKTIEVGAFISGLGYHDSNAYSITEGHNGNLLIVDSGANSIVRYNNNNGNMAHILEFPDIDNPTDIGPPVIQQVPTQIRSHDGGLYVSTLSGFPFLEGLSRIYRVHPNGNSMVVHDDLTLVTGFSFDPADGNLVVSQFSESVPTTLVPFSGSVVKINDAGNPVPVATGVHFATSVEHGAGGVLFFGSIATGNMYRIDPGSMSYCDGASNSVGDGAVLTNSGSVSVSANDLAFTAVGLPAETFGVLIMAGSPVNIPLGDGYLCTSGPNLARLAILQSDDTGLAFHHVDNANLPPTAAAITAGDLGQLQYWYRDADYGDFGYNLSNGVQVLFKP